MANGNKNIFFSDLIGDAYKAWKNTIIVFDGGTGRGKTHFIIHVFGKYLKKTNKTMLYICNRSKLKEQITKDVTEEHLDDVITVTTYQAIQMTLRSGESIQFYDYIVIAHLT